MATVIDKRPMLKKWGARTGPQFAGPLKQRVLLSGWPGRGKTTALLSIPNCLLLDFEWGESELPPVHPDTSARIQVTNYEQFAEIVDWLVNEARSKNPPFEAVGLDTLDMLGGSQNSLVAAYILRDSKVDAITAYGRNGLGWAMLTELFSRSLTRLVDAGYGLFMTCHLRRKMVENPDGSVTREVAHGMTARTSEFARSIASMACVLDTRVERRSEQRQMKMGDKVITVPGQAEEVVLHECIWNTELPDYKDIVKSRVPMPSRVVWTPKTWYEEFARAYEIGTKKVAEAVREATTESTTEVAGQEKGG